MRRVIIMGAAGRDFHNFNTYFRENPNYEVVAFTATQIPGIEGRKYPTELAGNKYPEGIPIHPERDLPGLIAKMKVDEVVFAYSDVPHQYVMEKAAIVNAAGADFSLLGPKSTMIRSKKPVVAICAVRTGCGKSQTTRRVAQILKKMGKRIAVVRHPMPYGDLREQIVQRFGSYADFDKHKCTIEEREEYEPHVENGNLVFAGVDYGKILEAAEKEADIILWDGGNNDFSFYTPDLLVVIADPHRPGHELTYYPGAINLRMADIVIINKTDTARPEDVALVESNIRKANPKATIVHAESPVSIEDVDSIKGKRVLVIDDGPTMTHGGMRIGAGMVAARKFGAGELTDGKKFAVGSILETYRKFPHLEKVLPAMGYGEKQVAELQETINRSDAEAVIIGTPIDLAKLIKVEKKCVRVRYDLLEKGNALESALQRFK
ncbi:MAG: cyclic 2,3-diphosphoglycerate synthase [Candidatus Micrarchaeota archaeon]